MIKAISIGLCVCVIMGCTQAQQPPQPQPIIIQQSVVSKPKPVPQPAPSTAYLAGYNDGYYGTWLAPAKWTFGIDYRNGWSAGSWDRRHNKPHRFANYRP